MHVNVGVFLLGFVCYASGVFLIPIVTIEVANYPKFVLLVEFKLWPWKKSIMKFWELKRKPVMQRSTKLTTKRQ